MKVVFREHRGSLADSLKTLREFHSVASLVEYLGEKYDATPSDISCEPYGVDKRIGYAPFLIMVKGKAPVGWTNVDISVLCTGEKG